MNRTLRTLVSFTILFLFTTLSSTAISQTIADSLITANEQSNSSFNTIYRQTVNPGFFGNEYGNPIKTSLVADINPNVVILNSSKSRFFVIFSPRVKLRLLDARKAPVRSPSYMPGLQVFSRLNNDIERPQFLSLAYTHHSNGQDGPTLDSVGNLNIGKGKFTTNYYTFTYTYGQRNTGATESVSKFGSLGLEIHTGLFNIGYSKELTGQYGFVRLNGSLIYDLLNGKPGREKYDKHHRIHARFNYILDEYKGYSVLNLSKRFNADVQYQYQPGFADNVALTIGAGYRGQDDYNIYFNDSYTYVSVGVAYGIAFDLRKNAADKHFR